MPTKDRVSGSQFNRRITIQQNAPTHDANGTPLDNWTDVYSCWADIQDFPMARGLTRAFQFSQFYPNATLMIILRFQKSVVIDATKRVKYPAHGIDHFYAIVGVKNPSQANTSMVLFCNESGAKAQN